MGTNPAFRVTSPSAGQGTSLVELRFFLTQAQVEDLERRRHASRGDVFNLYLRLEPTVIGLKILTGRRAGAPPAPRIWKTKYGDSAELAVFLTAHPIEALPVDVETSTWVRRVLPGLGHDRVRLIEVALPPALPEQPNAAVEFDKANAALDARRYDDSIAACRGLFLMWAKQLGATRTQPVATVVSNRLGWTEADGRRKFFDALWTAEIDFVNAAHHREDAVQSTRIDYRDARLTMLVTAVLSEYVGSLPP
jgi:hypothetical protein